TGERIERVVVARPGAKGPMSVTVLAGGLQVRGPRVQLTPQGGALPVALWLDGTPGPIEVRITADGATERHLLTGPTADPVAVGRGRLHLLERAGVAAERKD